MGRVRVAYGVSRLLSSSVSVGIEFAGEGSVASPAHEVTRTALLVTSVWELPRTACWCCSLPPPLILLCRLSLPFGFQLPSWQQALSSLLSSFCGVSFCGVCCVDIGAADS